MAKEKGIIQAEELLTHLDEMIAFLSSADLKRGLKTYLEYTDREYNEKLLDPLTISAGECARHIRKMLDYLSDTPEESHHATEQSLRATDKNKLHESNALPEFSTARDNFRKIFNPETLDPLGTLFSELIEFSTEYDTSEPLSYLYADWFRDTGELLTTLSSNYLSNETVFPTASEDGEKEEEPHQNAEDVAHGFVSAENKATLEKLKAKAESEDNPSLSVALSKYQDRVDQNRTLIELAERNEIIEQQYQSIFRGKFADPNDAEEILDGLMDLAWEKANREPEQNPGQPGTPSP